MTNRKIASEIAVGIILLLVVVIGGIFWLQSKKTETSNQEPVTSKNEVQKPKVDAPVITIPNKQQSMHVAYTRQLSTSEEPHLIYDGNDLGEVMNRYFAISGNHIGFFQKINNESHIIYDGKDLGDGSALELDGDNITFIRTTNENNPHVIHNGIDFGRVDGEQDVMFDVSGDNVALERIIDGKTHIFYNQKDLGEGKSPSVGENSVAFLREIGGKYYVIYNGQGMGEGDDIYSVSDKYVFFSRRDSKQGATSSYFRNQEYIGTGDVSGRIKVSGDHYVLYQVDNALIDGKDIGDISTSLQVNKIDQLLANGNYAHYKDVDGETHIFHNGKDLGEGTDFDISENNIVFTRIIDGNDHVIFNGKDLGEGRFPVISGDNIVYANTVKAANGDSGTIYHVFFNGKDMGECAPSQGPDFSKTLGNCQNIKFSN